MVFFPSRLEFPYPKEKPFTDKTAVVKDTNNPEYNHKAIIPVNPKDKSYQRVFKRQSAKVFKKIFIFNNDYMLTNYNFKSGDVAQWLQTLHATSFPQAKGRAWVRSHVSAKPRWKNWR